MLSFTIYHYNYGKREVEKEEIVVNHREDAVTHAFSRYGFLNSRVFVTDIANAFIWPITKDQFESMVE